MKDSPNVSLCLFGQMRAYKRCHKYLRNNILDDHDPDIFIHTWRNRGGTWKSGKDESISESTITEEKLDMLYSPEAVEIETFHEENYRQIDDVRVPEKVWELPNYQKGMVPMFYKMYSCNELKNRYERENGTEYDIVVLTRPDLAILDKIPSRVFENPNVIWTSFEKPYQIKDQIVISSSDNIHYFTSIWENLPEYWESELGDMYGEMGVVPGTYTTDVPVNIGNPERLIHYHIKRSYMDDALHGMRAPIIRRFDRIGYCDVYTYLRPVWNIKPAVETGLTVLRKEGAASFARKTARYIYTTVF